MCMFRLFGGSWSNRTSIQAKPRLADLAVQCLGLLISLSHLSYHTHMSRGGHSTPQAANEILCPSNWDTSVFRRLMTWWPWCWIEAATRLCFSYTNSGFWKRRAMPALIYAVCHVSRLARLTQHVVEQIVAFIQPVICWVESSRPLTCTRVCMGSYPDVEIQSGRKWVAIRQRRLKITVPDAPRSYSDCHRVRVQR